MQQLNAYQHIYGHNQRRRTRHWSYGLLASFILALFLPWTQTIRAKGTVISLRQEQRIQEINTIIGGRIVKWHIKEGDFVQAGDTLVQLAEIKDAYLDPALLDRTQEQITAKEQSIENYRGKVAVTGSQVNALETAQLLKQEQLDTKLRQLAMKAASDSLETVAAANEWRIALLQYGRQQKLFDSGLVSLTQLETRNQALQNAVAKKLAAETKWLNTKQELSIVRIEKAAVEQDYTEKKAKAESDRFGSLSLIANSEGDVAKLQNQAASYRIRNGMYYILAPQSGQIVRARRAGLGEVLKEGETLLSVVPQDQRYGVELFVRPVDLPLIAIGQTVQFQFDGFPAIVFSGWPKASYGVFSGRITAVEGAVSANGLFRVMVSEAPGSRRWPKELKMGAGANGIALLNDVPVWYELWRNINSFPPDYYGSKEKEAKK
ncbi:MAG: secretion protein HlyD family protein [Flaviaesturariibacter sp.]|nr:secretion protein HlyD family protein [Flaviaesturariibacter sp.]